MANRILEFSYAAQSHKTYRCAEILCRIRRRSGKSSGCHPDHCKLNKGITIKNILIIVSHPKRESFSFAMAETYKITSEKKGNRVEILDLYRDAHQQPFFSYENANELEVDEAMQYYQNKISQADEIAFVFPFWWGSYPAILKNFFDWSLSRGFAFKYVNSRPRACLRVKQ